MSRPSADAAATAVDLRYGQVGLLQARLRTLEPAAVQGELTARIASAPQFFRQNALCLDFAALPSEPAAADVRAAMGAIAAANLVVVGVADGVPYAESLGRELGLPVLAGFRAAPTPRPQPAPAARQPEPPPPAPPTLVHTQPVRSGQRVYARDRDLVVIATVGAGAEVMADGCVHVYGPLRGRAMAGVRGDANARLFCQEFRAELVAVAGVFRVFETIPPELAGHPVQAWLEGEELKFERLGA